MKKPVFINRKPYYQYSSLDGNRFSFSEFNSNLPCNIFTNSSTSVHDCCLTILFNSHIRRIVRTSTIQNYEVKEEQEFLRDFIINKYLILQFRDTALCCLQAQDVWWTTYGSLTWICHHHLSRCPPPLSIVADLSYLWRLCVWSGPYSPKYKITFVQFLSKKTWRAY